MTDVKLDSNRIYFLEASRYDWLQPLLFIWEIYFLSLVLVATVYLLPCYDPCDLRPIPSAHPRCIYTNIQDDVMQRSLYLTPRHSSATTTHVYGERTTPNSTAQSTGSKSVSGRRRMYYAVSYRSPSCRRCASFAWRPLAIHPGAEGLNLGMEAERKRENSRSNRKQATRTGNALTIRRFTGGREGRRHL